MAITSNSRERVINITEIDANSVSIYVKRRYVKIDEINEVIYEEVLEESTHTVNKNRCRVSLNEEDNVLAIYHNDMLLGSALSELNITDDNVAVSVSDAFDLFSDLIPSGAADLGGVDYSVAQPITYNDLLNKCSDGTMKNGVVYSCSGVPGLDSNDRLFAIGCVNELDPGIASARLISVWHDSPGKYTQLDGVVSQSGELVYSWKNNNHPKGVEIYFDFTCNPLNNTGTWWTNYRGLLLNGFGTAGRLTIDRVPIDNIRVFNGGTGVINQTGDITLKKGCLFNIFNAGSSSSGITLNNVTVEENSTLNITGTTGGGSLTNITVKGTVSFDGIHSVENGVLGGRNTTAGMGSPYDLDGSNTIDFGDIPLTKVVKIANAASGGIDSITGWYTPVNHGLEIIFDLATPTDFNIGSSNLSTGRVGVVGAAMTGTQTVSAWAKFLLAPDGNAYLLDYI